MKSEGLPGFYRGAASLVATVPLRSSFNITLYSHIKHSNNYSNHFLRGFIPGCIAGGVLSVFVCPIEMVKCTMQVSKEFKSSYECMRELYSRQGLKYLFRGLAATFARDILGIGVFFGVYEFIKGTIHEYSLKFTWWGWIACGSFSGAFSWIAVLPIDCVKTRYQLSQKKILYNEVIKDIYYNHGIKGFWVGALSTIIRTFIANGVGFSIYELIKHHLPKVILV